MTAPVHNTIPMAETVAWLHGVRLADHPVVLDKARLVLLDTLACSVAGMAEPEVRALARGLAGGARGDVQWPAGEEANAAAAAFVAATAACWHEACEGLARAHGRPGLHAIPVAVSLGLAQGDSLGAVLEAIVHGYEIGGRAGEAMRIRKGLHVDGTWGLLASVAAAARMKRFDAAHTLAALSTAACQMPTSLYAPIAAGRTARNTYVSHAVSLAIQLVEAVAAGITAPDGVFEQAARNLGAGDAVAGWPWAPPGEYVILEGYLKPFAAVRHVHYAAACALARFRAHGGATERVTGVDLHTYAEALTYCGNRAAATPIQAQFSLTHGTAFALRHGSLGPEAYARGVFEDPEHRRLEALIAVRADGAIKGRGARLVVQTAAGSESYAVTSVPGDPDQPLTAADVRAKALAYMTPALGPAAAAALIEHILSAPADGPILPAMTAPSLRRAAQR